MAMSEVFNLDFKFGGNVELLAKLENLLNRIDQRFDSVEDSVNEAAKATDNMADKVDDLNDSFKEGVGAMSEFGEKLKDIAKYYLSFQAIRAGAEKVWSFGMESMDKFSTQERAENQLKGVMKNRGNLDQFQAIKDYAAAIQGRSIYGDEAIIKGAGELATYVKGTESLKSMMDLLTDYAAGMTGGGEVSPEQMESLATGLGMAYDGNYMAMRRKGFDTSKLEALDALAENGGVWTSKMQKKFAKDWSKEEIDDFKKVVAEAKKVGGITEQMRVDALKDALGDWQGLSDAVNDLDSSALIRFNNKLSDLRENIGKRLYPTFNKLVEGIEKHMPDIEGAFNAVASAFETMAEAFSDNIDEIKDLVKVFSKALEIFAKFPKATIAVGLALKSMASGAFKAKSGFAALSVQMKGTIGDIMKMEGAMGGLVGSAGGGAVMGFTADVGSDKSSGENAQGALFAMAKGAALGAVQFGALGAAIGAAAAVMGTLAKGIIEVGEAWDGLSLKDIPILGKLFPNSESKNEKDENQKNKKWEKMMRLRDEVKNARLQEEFYKSQSSDWDKKERANATKNAEDKLRSYIEEYEKEYGAGSAGTGVRMTLAGGADAYAKQQAAAQRQAEKDAKKKGKGDIANTYNNTYIEQKVNVAAEVEKIGMLLNFSVRAAIQQAMKQNKNQMAVGEI